MSRATPPTEFASAPALAQSRGELLLAFLSFDGAAECVRLTRSPDDGQTWTAPADVSAPGVVFAPAIAALDDAAWVCWVARDHTDASAEQATFSLYAAPCHGAPGTRTRLAGGTLAAGRPYHPALAATPQSLWLVHELWHEAPIAADQPVTLQLHQYREGAWQPPLSVPAPWPAGSRAPRMYAPSIAAAPSGAVHVVWWSPNADEVWEGPGTRPGTTADHLALLPSEARHGHHDGGSTGSDVWHTCYLPGRGAAWSEPERLNRTAGWHINPAAAVDAGGRLWVTWAAVTRTERYPTLTSDLPYVQTSRARARRAAWFREARPVVRRREASDGSWQTAGAPPRAATDPPTPPGTDTEPGTLAHAGHSFSPTLAGVGDGIALVLRRYGDWQAAETVTGDRHARLRAFETAVLWPQDVAGASRGQAGWTEAQVLHEPELGGQLTPPAVLTGREGLLVAWQSDEATRNRHSAIRVGRALPAGSGLAPTLVPLEPDRGSRRQAAAAPVAVSPPTRPLWGNIHIHTVQSFDRRETSYPSDFNYRWSQDCMRQDFAVLTDHVETKSVHEWWSGRKAAAFYTTASFAAILGYEWSPRDDPETGRRPGHLNVYFRGDSPRFWPSTAAESSTMARLWEALANSEASGYPAFTAGHHTAVSNNLRDWSRWGGETFEPVVEIQQDRRGSFERPGAVGGAVLAPEQYVAGHHVSDALARGYRMGFVAGGDHMGISLTAVLAAAATREAIFDAIRSRRCYAVTAAKVVVDLTLHVGDRTARLGDVVTLTAAASTARLTAHVHAPSRIRRLVVVEQGTDTIVQRGDGAAAELEATLRPPAGGYCYLRVELEDGEIAWTSPVYFDAEH